MRLFRTVSFKEFSKIVFGETILPKQQRSNNCKYLDEYGKMVSAADTNPSFICCFQENIFWYRYDEREVMLELEIPDDRIVSNGYGNYYTMMWNPFINDNENGWWVSGEFGLKRAFKDGIKISLKETYISNYSRTDVINVYFLDKEKIPYMGINYAEDHIEFNGYGLYENIIRKFSLVLGKRYHGRYNDSNIWNPPYNPNLSLVKKLLINDMNQFDFSEKEEVIAFIRKFMLYNDIKVLERALVKNSLKTAFNKTLSTFNIAYTLNQYFSKDYLILENMYEIPAEKPLKLVQFVDKFRKQYSTSSIYETNNWDWNISEQFIYSMMKKANVI